MYFVYIMTNKINSTLYIGFTYDLKKRAFEHRTKLGSGFTKRYNLTKLVYYEFGEGRDGVLGREKEMKKWSRMKKERYITAFNPSWEDLYDSLD
mgnify:CR=1 FL=1|jgi:putative endonuclease